jgi:amino acid transporter
VKIARVQDFQSIFLLIVVAKKIARVQYFQSIINAPFCLEFFFSKNYIEMDIKSTILPSQGYTQELRRRMDSMMAFTFCFTAVAVTTSISGLFIEGIRTGGPVVLIWSWIIGSILTIIVCSNLAEISSTYPSAGSVYHWAGLLASREYAPLASYITGWFNALGNVAADAFFGYAFAQSVNEILITFSYELSIPFQVIIGVLITIIWALQNFLVIEIQGKINHFASMWQIMTTLTILITLFFGATKSESFAAVEDIFLAYRNDTGFESVLYVVCIGILTSAYSFTGYESGSHLAEETINPKVNVPKGIFYTGICTAITGFVFILGLLMVTAHKVDIIVRLYH